MNDVKARRLSLARQGGTSARSVRLRIAGLGGPAWMGKGNLVHARRLSEWIGARPLLGLRHGEWLEISWSEAQRLERLYRGGGRSHEARISRGA